MFVVCVGCGQQEKSFDGTIRKVGCYSEEKQLVKAAV